ncbi:RapZ C-terminal domain-containing protein [Streptacidiphilus anmyonensis]|uniref:RapZ C-terminal domain-containing protein n=1 Tax=Streptacidiphilus anmyonensis TaxID=405782 RepID=UPI0005AB010B|nr:RNase adapter RapZ [Streptacidiphilus anmyonensis]
MPPIEITSFGYLHGDPPPAHVTCDLRQHFRDPHWNPELRQLTARDEPVAQAVMTTPGILAVVDALAAMVRAYLAGPAQAPLKVAIGCAGGRHRSAQVTQALAQLLREEGTAVTVVHRDINLPVVAR